MTDRRPGQRVSLEILSRTISNCRRCPELREYCSTIGRTRRRAFADWDYWARPVPGFGNRLARMMIVGLAPAAHGANRTGRMFTGDRSGDFLYAALHRAGLANQAVARSRDDGLELRDVFVTAALRCAPPGNRPRPAQLANCRPYLAQEIQLLSPRVLIALGSIGWNAALRALMDLGEPVPSPRPKFGHGQETMIGNRLLLGCYHVSQQNTFTGRLTESMLDAILQRGKEAV